MEANVTQLFTKEQAPRTKSPVRRMRVIDAGFTPYHVHFVCRHCGHDEGFKMYQNHTITELKRGLPCPKCNVDKKNDPKQGELK